MIAAAKKTPPKPPATLGKPGKKYWKAINSQFVLEPHHIDLLFAACVQLDRAEQARSVIAEEGVIVADRYQQKKEHPAVAIERKAHGEFRLLSREMGLDIEPPLDIRGPRRPGADDRYT